MKKRIYFTPECISEPIVNVDILTLSNGQNNEVEVDFGDLLG